MIAKRNERVVARQIDDEAVLLPIRTDTSAPLTIYALDPVAAFVWEACDGQRSIDAIADLVTQEFEVDPARASADLRTFVAELAAAGLVELA